ncbi:putative epethelial sodium channel-like 3 [Homarus americanus]|uniref:Putative epethelial sodium channel-like 3 n=1 Tax=Homarus americanus TaxID=6706 RepID=A0A8J5NDB7_HOMAM|nr:putative epethelial sodium channel-like 3 [Homarus americanus]
MNMMRDTWREEDGSSEMKVPVNISNYLMAIASSPFILSRELQGRTRKSLQFLQEADAQLQEILRERNMTLSQLIDALSLSCKEIIIQCMYGSHVLNSSVCCSFTKKVKTVLGLCYVTYATDEVRQVSTGDYMGFTYYLNDVSDHEPEIMSSIIEKSLMVNTGLQVTLISDVTLPSYLVGRQGAIINPGTLTTMELDLTMMDQYGLKTLVDREEVACIPSSKLHNLEWRSLIHTSVNCELANYRDCIQVLCPNCSLYAHQDFDDTDKPICSVQETARCFSELFNLIKVKEEVLNNTESCWALSKSRCVRVCEELIFLHTNTVNQISASIMQPLTEELNVPNTTKVSVVAIFYPKLQYRFIRFYRKTLMLALGNFGSFMGVMIGSSLITVLEVFIFFCLALCAVWDKLRPRLDH